MTSKLSIIDVLDDPDFLGPSFEGASWDVWRAILKAAFALPMTDAEIALFRTVADRDPPTKQVDELWVIAGRRSGKDSVAAAIMTYFAGFNDFTKYLRPGESALCMALACDRQQAKIVVNYCKGNFDDLPALGALVRSEDADGLVLSNRNEIAVHTNSIRAVRGRSCSLIVLDEVAYYRDDRSVSPDTEVYNAVKPSLATMPGSLLVGISSPYRKAGLLYEKHRDHYGKNDDDVLVVKGPTTVFNPTVPAKVIEDAVRKDPQAAAAEWFAEFRSDIATFVDRALIEGAVDRDVLARPPVPTFHYQAFTDPSGGAGDSFTAAISHPEGELAVLDCLYERKPPFSPTEVVAEIAALLRTYGLTRVTGDHYSAGWVVEAFAKVGVTYQHSERDRSSIYANCLPLFTSGRARLIDNPKMVNQFAGLERRTSPGGKDRIDHASGSHDDLCNSAAGALVLASKRAGLDVWIRLGQQGTNVPQADIVQRQKDHADAMARQAAAGREQQERQQEEARAKARQFMATQL